MANRNDILTPVWGIGLQDYGTVVTDIECIRQRIDIAIRTTKGSDPLRPNFGSNVFKYQDAPVTTAIANIKHEILTAIKLWVPDVTVKSITHSTEIKPGHVNFFITYTLVNQDVIDSIQIGIGGGIITGGAFNLILQDVIPSKTDLDRYKVYMELNGTACNPLSNLFGYSNIDEMFAWVVNNWGYLANWYIMDTVSGSGKKLVAYIKDKQYTSGLLDVFITTLTRVAASFPELPFGSRYETALMPEPGSLMILEGNLYDPQAVLLAAQQQWYAYGTWVIESKSGDFSGDFSSDFNVADLQLVLYTYSNPAAAVEISVV